MKTTELTKRDVETIFETARVNGGLYLGDHLTAQRWDWPQSSWFQNRLRELRDKERGDEQGLPR
jgi:hypothetical protein